MSTILITGGAGFIGSHLTEGLLARGHQVLILDDLSSGDLENINHLRENNSLQFFHGSVKSFQTLDELVERVDLIYHLAATVGVYNIIQSPVRTISNNIGGTEAVLRAASMKQVPVVVASTSEVYGKSTATPFREDGDVVLGPTSRARWSYATSKLADEFMALAYWRERHVPTVVVRLFNTIGPRQSGRYGMVVPRFINQALVGRPLTVFGTGRQTRCFTYIRDVVEWMILLPELKQAVGRVFNLGNPFEVSIRDLAATVVRLAGANVEIQLIPYEKAYDEGFEDMERRVPDISRVVGVTGYSPKYDLETMIGETIDWFRLRRTG
ncbi:MAG: NAD-dependent epimerase/dehydratase family protein [Bryobacteraceae bacterium]